MHGYMMLGSPHHKVVEGLRTRKWDREEIVNIAA